MPKWIPLLALVAVAAVGAVLLTQTSQKGQGLEQTGRPEMGIEPDTDPASLLASQGSSQTQTQPQGPAVTRETEVQRASLGPTLTQAKGGGNFTVVAIDPRTKRPVEGMRVLLANREAVGLVEWQSLAADSKMLRDWMASHGTEMFTDAEGKAYFERVLQGAVLAEGQGWSSVADWIGPVESPYYLRLVPRTELVVQVLDSEDHGVSEVPVSIGTVADARWLPMIQRGTSAAGMARFDGVERLALRAQKEQALGVYLGFPHLPRVYQLIDPANLTNETITLKLPAYAAMTLEVLDGQGKRIEQPLKAELGLVDGLEESPFQPILARRSTTGLVEFPFVGCGAPLLVRLSGIPELQDQVIELRGPDRNGVPVERAVTWYQRRTIFVGTARDRGQALAGRTIRATWGDGRDNRSLPTTTGPNGEFRIVTTGPEARFLNLEIVAKDGGLPYSANPPIPNPLPGGEYSLDPIQWETLPVFLEGRVVDSAGVPIPGAFVKLESKQKGSAGQDGGDKGGSSKEGAGKESGGKDGGEEPKRSVRGSDRAGKGGMQDERTFHWAPVPKMTALTDQEGNFRLYGKVYATDLRLQATRRGFAAAFLDPVRSDGGQWVVTMEGLLSEVNAREQAQDREQEEQESGGKPERR